MFADTSDCYSLDFPSVVKLATTMKVQVVNRAPDASFKGEVCKYDNISSTLEPRVPDSEVCVRGLKFL